MKVEWIVGIKSMKIAIVDYQMGNLFSVRNACDFLEFSSFITNKPDEIANADAVILPGVGAFGKAMDTLQASGISEALLAYIETGKPFLGICLGMQLLFTESDEFGTHKGLNVIEGEVRHFSKGIIDNKAKVPNVGWCRVKSSDINWEDSFLRGVEEGEYMYFTHSHYTIPKDDSVILTTTEYGGFSYCSSIKKGNITATQFHPEKSSKHGLNILRNFGESLN